MVEFEIGEVKKIRAYNCNYYLPDDVENIETYPEIKRFHDTYFDGSTPDLPLGYVICKNRIIYAIAVYAHDYGIDIDIIDVHEWLSDDP